MNRSKAPLILMEQLVMLLVFALAAALCIRAFVLAEIRSQENSARAQAIVEAQNMAERYQVIQNAGPVDQTNEPFICYYDEDWNQTEGATWAYCLKVEALPTENPYLGRAELLVSDRQGKELVTLPLAWQVNHGEVTQGG